MSRDQLDIHFKKHPEIELNIARHLARHVLSRQKGNKLKSAFAWLHGHNLHPSDISNERLINSDYIAKYKKFNKLNPFNKPDSQKVASFKFAKNEVKVDSSDFKVKLQSWLSRRESYLTQDPMRTSNFQPDMGRVRDDELDEIYAMSQLNPEERLQHNIKLANKR
jgi:hypothetical protein